MGQLEYLIAPFKAIFTFVLCCFCREIQMESSALEASSDACLNTEVVDPVSRLSSTGEPPDYTAQDYSTDGSGSPPPAYTVPHDLPPAYQTPPVTSPLVQYAQSSQRTVIQTRPRPANNSELYNSTSSSAFLRLLLACGVFWLCGFLFGAVAFILASE